MPDIRIKRVREPRAASDGYRVLIDRLWPRGVSKQAAAIDHWARELAPSTELRTWFGHDPARWEGFRQRYAAELGERSDDLAALLDRVGEGRLTLLFDARDTARNNAAVLKEVLGRLASTS